MFVLCVVQQAGHRNMNKVKNKTSGGSGLAEYAQTHPASCTRVLGLFPGRTAARE